MADTTHNVTIKATLDTSTNDSTSNRSGSHSSGGGSGSGNLASGIAVAGSTFVKTIDLARHSLSTLMVKLMEMGTRLDLLTTMYYRSHSNIAAIQSMFDGMNKVANYFADVSLDEFEEALKSLDYLTEQLENTTNKLKDSDQAKVDSSKRVTQAQDRQAQAADKAADAAKKQTSAFETGMTNFMKWALVSQAAGNLSRNYGDLADIVPTESQETRYKWYSRIGHVIATAGQGAGAGAGIGAAAGSVSGPGALITTAGGAIIGGLFGLTTGILDEVNKFTKETEDKTNEMNDLAQSATALAKSQSDMRKSIQKTIEKINRDIYDSVILETAPDQLESTLVTLEENILLITKDISDLNAKFIQGNVSLENYNETMEDMQDKLSREKSLRDELSTRYEREQDREISEIQRQTQNFDYISELLYKQIELGKQESNSKVIRDGTWEQVLQALAEQNQLNLFEQSRSKGFFARMQDANFKQDWLAYDEAKMEFEESQRNLAFGLQMRSGLTSTLQEIFKEMMTYKGLTIRDFGSLAALGGFGSTSVLGDPMLDLQREQNRILGEMLRTIRDQDNSARYL